MNNFHNELQMLNVGDFNTSEAVHLDPNGSYSTQTAQLGIIGGFGGCFSCFSCFSCFNCL